jgi:hypothetical protein
MKLTVFWSDIAGSLKEKTALVVALIAIAGAGAAAGLDRLTREGDLPRIAIIPASSDFARTLDDQHPVTNREVATSVLDDSPVASIPTKLSRPIVLNPCNGHEE